MRLFYCSILLIIITSCQFEKKTFLTGSFNEKITDTLIVSDIVRSPESFDNIYVSNGNFKYAINTSTPELRVIRNKDQTIEFNLLTYPGKYSIEFNDNEYSISGKHNKIVKQLFETSKEFLIKQQKLIFSKTNDSLKNEKLESLNSEITTFLINSSKENAFQPIAEISAFASVIFMKDNSMLFDSLYTFLDTSTLDHTSLGKELQIYKTRNELPKSIPNISLLSPKSEKEKIEINTDYLFIDFWASWCKPCRDDIPNLKKVFQHYNSKHSIDFISISIDKDIDNWQQALSQEDIPWKQLIANDPKVYEEIKKHWGIVTIPHGVLINKKNETIKNHIKDSHELVALLKNILN